MIDLREQWKTAIIRYRKTQRFGEVRALLLYIAHHPNTGPDLQWSIPRSELAATFNVTEYQIRGWLKMARTAGLLACLVQGRPGVISVYRGVVPASHMGSLTTPY